MRRLSDEFPEMAYIRLQIAVLLDRLSFVYQNSVSSASTPPVGEASEALKALRLAIALTESLRAEYPANPDFQREWAQLQIRLGARLAADGKPRQAEEAFSKGLTVQAKLADDYPTLLEYRCDLAGGLTYLGNLLAKTERKSAAAKTFQQVLSIRQELIADNSSNPAGPGHYRELAWLLATCPDEKFRNPKLAVQMAGQAVELAPEDGSSWSALGVAHYRSGNWKEAHTALQHATRLRNGGACTDWLFLAMTCKQLGQPQEARLWLDKGRAWIEESRVVDDELARFRAEAEREMAQDNQPAQPPRGAEAQ